jgi:hypothetical protein
MDSPRFFTTVNEPLVSAHCDFTCPAAGADSLAGRASDRKLEVWIITRLLREENVESMNFGKVKRGGFEQNYARGITMRQDGLLKAFNIWMRDIGVRRCGG